MQSDFNLSLSAVFHRNGWLNCNSPKEEKKQLQVCSILSRSYFLNYDRNLEKLRSEGLNFSRLFGQMNYTDNGRDTFFFLLLHMHTCSNSLCHEKRILTWNCLQIIFLLFIAHHVDRTLLFCNKLSYIFELIDMQQELNLSCLPCFFTEQISKHSQLNTKQRESI